MREQHVLLLSVMVMRAFDSPGTIRVSLEFSRVPLFCDSRNYGWWIAVIKMSRANTLFAVREDMPCNEKNKIMGLIYWFSFGSFTRKVLCVFFCFLVPSCSKIFSISYELLFLEMLKIVLLVYFENKIVHTNYRHMDRVKFSLCKQSF